MHPAKRYAVVVVACLSGAMAVFAQASEADWTALAKRVMSAISAQHFAEVEARYDAAMKAALPPGKLAATWEALGQQVGTLREVTPVKVDDVTPHHLVILRCQFEKAVLDAKITFDAQQRIAGLLLTPHLEAAAAWSLPDYAKPASFHERAITVGAAPYELPGTLTLPNGNGPFPAVILVQGSGPSDQDETIGPNKPFKDLAVGLASQGVAVVRYIKRTAKYHDHLDSPEFTADQETTLDAIAAVALAAHQPEIDAARIVVLGHSFGGTMAPRIALRDPQVAGLVILGGSSRPLGKVIIEQLKYLGSLQPSADASAAVQDAERAEKTIESPDLKPTDSVKLLGTTVPGSYFLDLRSYYPASAATPLTIPILILQAARDYQVTINDFNTWRESLGNKPNVAFKLYPNLFHLFMVSTRAGNGLGGPSDYDQPSHVVANVVDDIAQWVLKLPAHHESK